MPQAVKKDDMPKGIHLDAKGRVIDNRGHVISLTPGSVATLKINQKGDDKNKRRVKEILKMGRFGANLQEQRKDSQFYDNDIEFNGNKRERRKLGAFSFIEQGTY
jgi:hypothetical protein